MFYINIFHLFHINFHIKINNLLYFFSFKIMLKIEQFKIFLLCVIKKSICFFLYKINILKYYFFNIKQNKKMTVYIFLYEKY